MIVFIVAAGLSLLLAVFVALPPLPPVPESVVVASDLIVNSVGLFVGLFSYVLGQALFVAFLVALGAIFAFEPLYHGIMWILRKIPVLGIK